MTSLPFNDGWTVASAGRSPQPVTLPRDEMLAERRSADARTGSAGGFFPGGRYVYRKTWLAPADVSERHVALSFGGVYRKATVSVNGVVVAENANGFLGFDAVLDGAVRAGENEIEVVADNTRVPNSRWYSGSGIYRPVRLEVRSIHRFAPDGVRAVTRRLDSDAAELAVRYALAADAPDDAVVRVELRRGDEVVADVEAPARAEGEVIVDVRRPRPWSAEDPQLYELHVRLAVAGTTEDEHISRIGVRTIEVDAASGLRVNGVRTLLRGAAIHSDNGVLGAAAFADAERRRIAIMKANGYNAIRTAHNPASTELLIACDELGMYVLDEYTDVWWLSKSSYDDSATFESDWRDDLAGIVRKDRNHPSVILYSISNENGETGTPKGVGIAREMVAHLHRLDATRPVTAGVNMFLNVMAARSPKDASTPSPSADAAEKRNLADSTLFNTLVHFAGPLMLRLSNGRAGDRSTRDVFDALDVAGYNYAHARIRKDAAAYPDRPILATESMPGAIPEIWALTDIPAFLGDMTWTGWDYLGEAGLGAWVYGKRVGRLAKPYPYIASGAGTIDLVGTPGAGTLLSRAVWGLLDAPAIAVRPLETSHLPYAGSMWRSSDAVSSWSWARFEGKDAHIEVYSADDEVELLLDGSIIGRAPAGAAHGFLARFRTPYRPGTLTAIGYRQGSETGRSTLVSAGEPALRLTPESAELAADDQALTYIRVEIADAAGVVESSAGDRVTVEVDGPAVLAGFGSGTVATLGSYVDDVHDTWHGRALAVLRATGETGTATIRARSRHHGTAETTVPVVAAAEAVPSR